MRRTFRAVNPLLNLEPSWNVAPTQMAPVVRRHPETGERHLDLLQWGLLPYFTKDPVHARRPINARAETVATSGTFRRAFELRRAIVPADAFYEWRITNGGSTLWDRPASPMPDFNTWRSKSVIPIWLQVRSLSSCRLPRAAPAIPERSFGCAPSLDHVPAAQPRIAGDPIRVGRYSHGAAREPRARWSASARIHWSPTRLTNLPPGCSGIKGPTWWVACGCSPGRGLARPTT
jgi:hypothetical protein